MLLPSAGLDPRRLLFERGRHPFSSRAIDFGSLDSFPIYSVFRPSLLKYHVLIPDSSLVLLSFLVLELFGVLEVI